MNEIQSQLKGIVRHNTKYLIALKKRLPQNRNMEAENICINMLLFLKQNHSTQKIVPDNDSKGQENVARCNASSNRPQIKPLFF